MGDELSTDELMAELRRARALEAICRDAGEIAAATPFRALARALEKKLTPAAFGD